MTATIIERSSGPNLLVRFVWWLFIGWWASRITVALAWFALVSIVAIPLGRPMDGGWVGQRDQSHDRVVRRGVSSADFTRYVKSTCRVLLTRGLRGCYVYFMDAPTRDFFLSRTENAGPRIARAAEQDSVFAR